MGNLSAPPVVTKPVDRDTVRQVVPESSVRSAERAVKPKPAPVPSNAPSASFIRRYLSENFPGRESDVDVKYVPGEGTFFTYKKSTSLLPEGISTSEEPSGGGLFGKIGDIAGDVLSSTPVKEVLSILDVLDIPRREIGKPVARALLEPLALAVDAADAISPEALSALPRVFPTGGQIRGATSVEILSFITDPLNLALFAGPAIKAAKAATLGIRLTLKESQALRKVVPQARRLLAEEAGGRVVGKMSIDEAIARATKEVESASSLNKVFARGSLKDLKIAKKTGRTEVPADFFERGTKPGVRVSEEAGGRALVTGVDKALVDKATQVFGTSPPGVSVLRGASFLFEDGRMLRVSPEGIGGFGGEGHIAVKKAFGGAPLSMDDWVKRTHSVRVTTSNEGRQVGFEFFGPLSENQRRAIMKTARDLGPDNVFLDATRSYDGKVLSTSPTLRSTGDLRGFLDELERNPPWPRVALEAAGPTTPPLRGELGGFPTRFVGKARRLEGSPPRLTKAVPVEESTEVKALRTKVVGEGRNPPPPPPPRLPGEPGGLLLGGQAPSISQWRTIENGLFMSGRASDLMRRVGEVIGQAPAMRLFFKAVTGPAALARVIPELRAGTMYQVLTGQMSAELGQRLAGQREIFNGLFILGRDTSKVVIEGKEVAFGDFATSVLQSARIGAPRSRFPATAAQREWIVTQKSLMDDLARQYEYVSGEKLRLLGEDYWPRFTLREDGRVFIKGRGRVGVKQSPAKERLFLEQEEAIARGTPYATPIETVRLYGQALQKMILDKITRQVFKEDKLGQPIIRGLRQTIKGLKAQAKAAKPTTEAGRLEVEVLRNKVFNLQAEVAARRRSLIPAKQALGPGFGKELLEPKAAKVIQDIIGPAIGGKAGKALRGVEWASNMTRFVVTGSMDVGQYFIQGLLLLSSDPDSWGRAVGRSLLAMADPKSYPRWLKNSPEAADAAKYGIGRGNIDVLEITKRSAALGHILGAGIIKATLGRVPLGFEAFIESGRILNFASLARIQRAGVGKVPRGFLPTIGRAAAGLTADELEGELFRIAGYVKTKLGTTDLMSLGLSATQRQAELAGAFYSPRYTRSILGMLGWAMSNGVPARDAQKALATMLMGGAVSFYAFGRATGLSHEEVVSRLNPGAGGKFLSLPLGGNEYGFGSAYRSLIGFMGQLLKEDNMNLETWASTDNPVFRYLRSRTAPTTGTLIDFIEGEDFLGQEVSLDTFIDDPARLRDYFQDRFLPLNLEAIIEARGPTEMKVLAGLIETVGGRAFPRSPFSLFEEAQELVFQEKRALGEKPYVDFDSFEDLAKENAPAVAVITTDPRVQGAQERLEHESRFRKKTREGEGFERLEETRVEQEKLQLEDDTDFNNNEMAVSIWKDNFRGRQGEFFARRDEIVQDFGLKFGKDKAGVNVAIDAYFGVDGEDYRNLMTGGVDWDRFFAARDATLEGLSLTNLQLVKDYLRRFDTPTVREFRKAQSDLDEYWAVEDLVWSRLRENGEFAPFLSLNDYLVSKQQGLLDSGVSLDEVSRTLSRLAVVSSVTSTVAKLRNRYRLTHPNADALLVKWYGLSPAKRPSRSGRGGRSGR